MNSKFNFKGVISALPTPFYQNQIDFQSLEKLVKLQLQAGVQGFVVNGTTGESPTLTWDEVTEIFKLVKQCVGETIPVILGTGSNATEKAKLATQKAAKLGADAALVVVPYYNKPTQQGLFEHFSVIADSGELPILLYNVPGRTITSLAVETIQKLAQNKNIIGIKEASGDLGLDQKIKQAVESHFIMLTGDDGTYIPFLKQGGHGVISVMSNLITEQTVNWQNQCDNQQFNTAESDFIKYRRLIELMFIEANPIPLKWMLYRQGVFKSAEARLPLTTLAEKNQNEIEAEMKKLGLI